MDFSYESNEHKNQEGHFRNEQPNPSPALSQRLINADPSEEQAFSFLTFGCLLLDSRTGLAVSRHCLHFMLRTFVGNFLKKELIDTTCLSFSYFFFFFFTFTGLRFWHLIVTHHFQCYHFQFMFHLEAIPAKLHSNTV